MTDVTVETRVQAPAAEIWKIWSDFPGSPQWDRDVRECVLDGPFQAGSRGRCTLTNGLNMPLVLEQVVPMESYRNSARLLWIDLVFTHDLRPISDRETLVIHGASLSGPLSFLYRGLLRRVLGTAMGQALDNLRALAERRAAAPQPQTSATPIHL
ncbi:SRPBCC family protein [Pseudomonas sp. ABC1]|uniref:SRPBCC family protein n=1 Tax=Pseudomonas sp. ABC1 TaxID=2748080 RepID=UPI0015C39BC3|nr:SRPBCC family protein [Pseudomonas sp. ABC1]QLF94924.1 SRPBCC family protein [Pseudomonas sp. ABC1]